MIKYKGKKVSCEVSHIAHRRVHLEKCTIGGKKVNYVYRSYATLINDADNDGQISRGDKYSYEVNDTDEVNFYVLFIEGDKVNLIMDINICKDGTIDYANDQDSNYCRYAWESTNTNGNGPIDAMTALGNGTRNWNNVPNINLDYDDITDNTSAGHTGSTGKGITITDGVGYITKKDGTTQTPITLTDNMPIKARLPKLKEITEAGCHIYNSSTSQQDLGICPVWLMGNMTYYNVSSFAGSGNTDKYSMNNNSEAYQNHIYGYWLMSSNTGDSSIARSVHYGGRVDWRSAYNSGDFGVRVVITVSKSDLS